MLNYTTTNDTQRLDCLIFYFPHSALKSALLRVVYGKPEEPVIFCFLVGLLPSNGGSLPSKIVIASWTCLLMVLGCI